jgi:hypothetical protein
MRSNSERPPKQGFESAPEPRRRPLGLFGEALLKNLKTSPPGASLDAIIMETLRSAPLGQVKAALAKADPKERGQLFGVIPNSQIRPIVGSLPANVLAPDGPSAPPEPAPIGGPPGSILRTKYENEPFPPAQSDPNWSTKISNGNVLSLAHPSQREWVSVYDPGFEKEGSLNNPMVGLTGWAVGAYVSPARGDVPFVHPFGSDFGFYIVPDPQYEGLLAVSNTGVNPRTGEVDKDLSEANQAAHDLGLAAPRGVLGVEIDHGLVPQQFRDLFADGTRVAAFGRWIVDCGHDDFHTEIHAPLLMAVAKLAPPSAGVPGALEMTSVQIVSRPYTVSQEFDEGNFVDHLLAEIVKVETLILGLPLSWRVEAHPKVFTTPYQGRPYVKLLVQPPPRRIGVIDRPARLMVNFHFTHRTGVALRVFDAGKGAVGIIIVFGDLNPAPLQQPYDQIVQWSDLGFWYAFFADLLGIANPVSEIILNLGIVTDSYLAPSASSPLDNQNVAGPVVIDELKPEAGLSEDDSQPFPIYGWLNVWWQEEQIIAG